MKTIFIFINSLIALIGLFFFKWNPFGLLLIYIFENFFLTILTLNTLKKQGGNSLLNKLLPIDTDFYNNQQLTKTKKSSPFFTFSFVLILYNLIIASLVYKVVNFTDPKIFLPILLSFAGLAINYILNNKKFLPLDSESKLAEYLSQPVKSLFVMYFGLIIGVSLYNVLAFPAVIIIGIILLRLTMDLVLIKHGSPDFNKKIISIYGIRMTKDKTIVNNINNMENQTNTNSEIINTTDNHGMPQESPKKRSKRKVFIRILLPLLGLAIIFYSFLGWKMTRTSNPFVSNPKFIFKSIFTWNPAELASNVFNKWDTLYLIDKKIMPAGNFLALKEQLEKVAKNEIYFVGLSNSIAIDDSGNYVNNKGSYVTMDNNKYSVYDFYIYKNEVKATKSYELDRKIGLTIYKQPQNVNIDTVKEYKKFTSAALKALNNINFKELITEKTKQISLSRFMEMNMIQTSNDSMKPETTITFDDEGKTIDDSRNKITTKKEITNQPINNTNTTLNNITEKISPAVTKKVDSDGDGLTDEEEKTIGTNINIVDSDGDGLNDASEVNKFKTGPLKPDTDGDGYTDGEEVKNGYDPLK